MPTKAVRPKIHPTNILRGVDWDSYTRMRNHPGNDHLRMSQGERQRARLWLLLPRERVADA
jgi:hypothetical protein